MIALRRSNERGHTLLDWLDSRHTFSFDHYHDPNHMGFSVLRVLNEDRVAPGAGFPLHPHRDMEIVTYILEGALEHRDSLGNGSVIRPGDVQRMSAGTGVTHSESNASRTEPVHLLQIWIRPNQRGLVPEYEQKAFPETGRRSRLCLVASPDGRDASLTIHQDAFLYVTLLGRGESVTHALAPGRSAYLHVARGRARLNGFTVDGHELTAGDAASVTDEPTLQLGTNDSVEALLFDFP